MRPLKGKVIVCGISSKPVETVYILRLCLKNLTSILRSSLWKPAGRADVDVIVCPWVRKNRGKSWNKMKEAWEEDSEAKGGSSEEGRMIDWQPTTDHPAERPTGSADSMQQV